MRIIGRKKNEHDSFIDGQLQKWIKNNLNDEGLIQNRLVIYLTGLFYSGQKQYAISKIAEIIEKLRKHNCEEARYQDILKLQKEFK
ncbi:MAG: hypothetical protein WC483_02855 [Candidatus Paceibacterota bacterium]|jgi:hypothetical protein|nr:hypothetical protein [Candidatus Paceibacterota bacterium]